MPVPMLDMYSIPEDDRIRLIGETATDSITGVMLEKKEPEKVRRYISKVTKRFPKVRYIDTLDVPDTKGLVVMVRFGPKLDA